MYLYVCVCLMCLCMPLYIVSLCVWMSNSLDGWMDGLIDLSNYVLVYLCIYLPWQTFTTNALIWNACMYVCMQDVH